MNRRQREFKKIKRFGEDAQVSLPIDAEVEAFQALSRMRNQGAWSTRGKAIALLCSFCLFAVSFLQLFELRGVLLLGGVLLFHEAGHIVGMRYFGFRDLKILFLPFIGAVALGKRQNVPAYQKVIVALLGPLPGIFLGLILMVGLSQFPDYSNNFLNELLWTLLAINFFNLLPLMPLDGGQVLHALFFSRYPFLEAAFSIVGALFLLLSGALTDSSLLILLSIMLLAGTKEQIRRSRLLLTLRKRMRAESESLDEQGVLRQIFSHLAERPKSARQSENFASRYQTAEYLLNHCRASQPNVWQSLTLVVLYLGCLLVVPVAVWKFHRHVSPVNAAEEAEPAPASTKSPGFREAKPEELQELSAVRV